MSFQGKAIGYVRVSTTEQAQEGISLEAQQGRIKAWAEANEFELVAIYQDAGLSGGRSDNRPALQQAIKAVTKDTALVVYSLSRLARSTRDALASTNLKQAPSARAGGACLVRSKSALFKRGALCL